MRPYNYTKVRGWVEMDVTKAYYIWRIGRSSAKVTEGNVYVVSVGQGFDGANRWIIKDTDNNGHAFHPTLTKKSKMWLVLATVESVNE